MFLADTPSVGLWLGVPIAGIVVVICVAFCLGFYTSKPYDWGLGFVIAAVVGFVTLVLTAVLMWPWKHDYHFYVPVSGRVERVSNRFISNGDQGVSQRFVVVLKGQPYGIDDTRASLLKEGDAVKLHCKKEFDWGSSDNGWACKWG